MSAFLDDDLVHTATNVTRELYETTSSSSSIRLSFGSSSAPDRARDSRQYDSPPRSPDDHNIPPRRASVRSSGSNLRSSPHHWKPALEASASGCTDDGPCVSNPSLHTHNAVAMRRHDPPALEFMTTHLEREGRAELLLTEEEQRRCVFRAFRAFRTLILIREADARRDAREQGCHTSTAQQLTFTVASPCGSSTIDTQKYLKRLLTHSRAGPRHEATLTPSSPPAATTRRETTTPPPDAVRRTTLSPARRPLGTAVASSSASADGAERQQALRDALLATLRELGPHSRAGAGVTRDDANKEWDTRWSSSTLTRAAPQVGADSPSPRQAMTPRSWRCATSPIRAEVIWNVSTNPQSLSAASRGLDASHILDDVSAGPSLQYRDNTASRRRRASSAARLAVGGTALRGQAAPVRPSNTRVRPAAPRDDAHDGQLKKPHRAGEQDVVPRRFVQRHLRELSRGESAAREDVVKAYWQGLNRLLHSFVVEGTAVLRQPGTVQRSASARRTASSNVTAMKHFTVTVPEVRTSLSSTRAETVGETSTTTTTATHHCVCLGVTLSDRLTVLSVDADELRDVRVGDRVASIEGTTVRQLSDVAAAEQVLRWDSTKDQYWTLVRGGQRRVVVHVTA